MKVVFIILLAAAGLALLLFGGCFAAMRFIFYSPPKLDLKANDSRKSLAATTLPVLFVHGDADAFVPPFMARECFDACAGEKQLVFYEGAGHGQSHFKHPEKYENDFFAFADRVTGKT